MVSMCSHNFVVSTSAKRMFRSFLPASVDGGWLQNCLQRAPAFGPSEEWADGGCHFTVSHQTLQSLSLHDKSPKRCKLGRSRSSCRGSSS